MGWKVTILSCGTSSVMTVTAGEAPVQVGLCKCWCRLQHDGGSSKYCCKGAGHANLDLCMDACTAYKFFEEALLTSCNNQLTSDSRSASPLTHLDDRYDVTLQIHVENFHLCTYLAE